MAVLKCGHCGAPRDPQVGKCAYCGAAFADATGGHASSAADREIEALIRKKQLLEAIKLYRKQYGTGLKEAKDAVEKIAERIGVAVRR